MNCIIIDDEAAARAIVGKLCSQIPDLDVIEEFDNAIDAIKFLNQQNIDVVFLDIHMPGFSGIDFVQTLKNPPKVVLTTSDTDFAIASYEYEAIVDYLVKPIAAERFEKCLQKVRNSLAQQPKVTNTERPSELGEDLYINIDRRLIKLKLDEIQVVEAKGDYIDIKTQGEDYHEGHFSTGNPTQLTTLELWRDNPSFPRDRGYLDGDNNLGPNLPSDNQLKTVKWGGLKSWPISWALRWIRIFSGCWQPF